MNKPTVVTLCLLSWSAGIAMHATYGSTARMLNNKIEQCELKLPRNKHCKVIAVPKGEVDE